MLSMIDISLRLAPGSIAWPGSPGFDRVLAQSMKRGDASNGSVISMDVHCGTHVEGPLHFIDDGAPLEATPLDAFIGPAEVIDVGGADAVTAELLERWCRRTANGC